MSYLTRRIDVRIILLAVAVFFARQYAFAFSSGDFEYSLDYGNMTAAVTKYKGSASSVSIPSLIDVPEQYKDEDGEWHTRYKVFSVIGIGESAFQGNATITSVELPSSVWYTSACSFADCTSLTSFPFDRITSYGRYSFRNCTSLKSVITSGLTTYYGVGVFHGCTSLVSAEINGSGDATINNGSSSYDGFFAGCSALETVKFGSGVKRIACSNSYGSDDISVMFCGCDSLREVDFGGITQLYQGSLMNRKSLKKCLFPNATSIGNSMFSGCSSLEEITPLDKITSIGDYAFRDCSSISGAIELPNIESIGRYAFKNCTAITSVTTSSKVGYYPYGIFQGCTSLVSAELNGNGNCTIRGSEYGDSRGDGFFKGCSSLKTVRLGEGIAGITCYQSYGQDEITPMFSGCDSLEEVYFDGLTQLYQGSLQGRTSLKKCLFPNATSIGNSMFSGCSSLEEITPFDKITNIGDYAFQGCAKLTSMSFSPTLTYIGNRAFYGCSELWQCFFAGVPPNTHNDAFLSIKSGAVGYYSGSHREEWLAALNEDKIWKRLIMAANTPIVTNDQYDVSSGSLRLNWNTKQAPMPANMTYEVRRGFSDNYEAAEILTNGYDQLTYTDGKFDSTGGTSRIWYWVKPEHEWFEPSEPCVTKNRYFLSIGFDSYGPGSSEKGITYRDATAVAEIAAELGGFEPAWEGGFSLTDGDATKGNLVDAINNCSQLAKPGDIVFCYLATHGAMGSETRMPTLSLYNGEVLTYFNLSSLCNSIVSHQSRFICVLMACHSEAMVTGGKIPADKDVLDNIDACGLRICGAYSAFSAWITSCQSEEVSYGTKESLHLLTRFSEVFCNQGWRDGYADVNLCIEGETESIPSHKDKRLSLREIADYAQKMYVGGNSTDEIGAMSHVTIIDQSDILSRIDVGPARGPYVSGCLQSPENVKVERKWNSLMGGDKQVVTWDAVPGAKEYRVYWRFGDLLMGVPIGKTYYNVSKKWRWNQSPCVFSVQAVNEAGISKSSASVTEKIEEEDIFPLSEDEVRDYFSEHGVELATDLTPEDWLKLGDADLDGDGVSVGEEIISGVTPLDASKQFHAKIIVDNDGKPVVSYEPDMGGSRKYTIYGRKTLESTSSQSHSESHLLKTSSDSDWVDMETITEGEKKDYKFFKVYVSLPDAR